VRHCHPQEDDSDAARLAAYEEEKRRRRGAQDDADFPDEVGGVLNQKTRPVAEFG
jgi:hypothetical protein